ncbi:hypothetical protein R4282_06950 [Rhodococcus oxybenzonivorans]|uniref:hypothetical protein n=1 Tax=Rhodococcus oxybenzonivorans TaxID=1990687 RepID=UPI002953F855|nr:hypothetical protein [Rhodococcus oxybenzonivorans]MDV7352751.1 hypothetical protein [Rhodococcus oxybenzonivorans]
MAHSKEINAADWTDQDLLTKDEAGERLDDEMVVTRARLGELESQEKAGADVAASLELVRRRLAAMESLRGSL